MRVLRYAELMALLVVGWCVMTFTHETGHIVGGLLSGGKLVAADLAPWRMPFSIFDPDPRPLITLWSGPLLGVAVPLLAAACIRRNWGWFLAYFCMLANGSYLALAGWSGDSLLDTSKLLAHGAHPLSVALYCAVTLGWGYPGFRRVCRRMLEPNARPTAGTSHETGTPGEQDL